MGRSLQPRRSRPHREFLNQRHAGQKDQGVYLSLRVCDDESSPLRGSGQLNCNIIYYVFTKTGSSKGNVDTYLVGQSQNVHSRGNLPA